jgi:hypothetical protein
MTAGGDREPADYTRRHLRFGWTALAVFAALGLVLEALHGFKLGWYLAATNETRRSMLTLAHAHGTLLSLINIAFALSQPHLAAWNPRRRARASAALVWATLLLPAGFFLGGLLPYAGDPGLAIVLVPPGALLLIAALALTARASR